MDSNKKQGRHFVFLWSIIFLISVTTASFVIYGRDRVNKDKKESGELILKLNDLISSENEKNHVNFKDLYSLNENQTKMLIACIEKINDLEKEHEKNLLKMRDVDYSTMKIMNESFDQVFRSLRALTDRANNAIDHEYDIVLLRSEVLTLEKKLSDHINSKEQKSKDKNLVLPELSEEFPKKTN